MIRLFSHYLRRRTLLQVLLDVALVLAGVISFDLLEGSSSKSFEVEAATHGLSLAACLLFINTASGLYQSHHGRSLNQTCARAALALLLALPLAYAIFGLFPADLENRDVMIFGAMACVFAVIVHRVYAAHADMHSRFGSRILIFGSGEAAQLVGQTLRAADPKAQIVGYFPAPNEGHSVVASSEMLLGRNSLRECANELRIDEIVVALTERRGGSMPLRDLLDCKVGGMKVSDISAYFEKMLGQIRIDQVRAGWLVFGDGFHQGLYRTLAKRAFDIICALLLLVVSAPLMLLTALAIALDSRGPVLYRQVRVGLDGQFFKVLKFRSMRADAEVTGQPQWAAPRDSRITRVGAIIRRFRIDELPQILNVLKGDMSLVGPRPERPYFVEQLTGQMPYYAVRHSVKPGVTGWAQVRYHYGATLEDSLEKLQYDLYYVKNHSLFLDLVIVFETIAVVLSGKGAR
jgi:sugar transferase (PEP-CTERM system associated)